MQKIWRVRPVSVVFEPLKGDAWLHKNGTWFELSWPTQQAIITSE